MSLDQRLARVRARIAAAESAAGRSPGSVRLLLATKTQDAAAIRAALLADAAASATTAGAAHRILIGENRVQELVAKAPELIDLAPELHLIGPLQSNKVNAALRWASCVQSVDSTALAERLDRRCAAEGRTLDVMVQVNVSGEPTKSGVSPADAEALADRVRALDRLRLRGLMTIGANSPDQDLVRAGFARLRDLGARIGTTELSMGMSRDLEAAVQEGATIVRVGTAVFGARG
ncbi:YggS family pyridoxal phosphate-dependent enzyme [Cellulomonas denverensis]|uniref:Pyridoxal phosphate homeostasis protein n=1 Tax=Cellulomonas denverensis TaxID=264297 RepID=A0A7X6KY36_9CELL|nr:YggS family pyridoxal phosphate-dependent enzyme [Cellulomonas denverensis]NKY24139.1 YggS family pyridoxal phosphate-dependent enzyme [Cellulomonas denverensis]GIG25317.1 YggS family pyridoxal phosphate enzyme [Cellulomonas denverensis]